MAGTICDEVIWVDTSSASTFIYSIYRLFFIVCKCFFLSLKMLQGICPEFVTKSMIVR